MIYLIVSVVCYVVTLTSIYLWEKNLTVADLLVFGIFAAVPLLNVLCALFAAGATVNYLIGLEWVVRILEKKVF